MKELKDAILSQNHWRSQGGGTGGPGPLNLNATNDNNNLTKKTLTEKFDVLRGRLLGNHNDFRDFFTCFFKYHKWKNRLFPKKPLPLRKPLRFASSAKSLVHLGNNFFREAEGYR